MAFSLPLLILFGAVFVPLYVVQAGFISSLFGNDAFAKTDTSIPTVNSSPIGSNVQSSDNALTAKVSSLLNSGDKGNQNGADSASDSTNTKIVDNAFVPPVGPMGVSDGTDPTDTLYSSDDQTSVYVVRAGDNIAAIAKMFGVSVNTILWANDMKKGDKLVEGDVLFILPVSGLQHTVAKGQTLQSIAKLYKVDVNEIIQYNDVTLDTPLALGDKLIIPNALKAEENDKPIPVKDLSKSIAQSNQYYASHPTFKNLSGYYIDPVPGYRLSQGIHDGNAVDLAIGKGTPIHAAASGTVIFARMGNNGGYGGLTIIAHPNGTETLYAHQSKISTTTGAEVSQGEVIGYVGSTGRSTGPHLHFEVKGARNPGADGSWAH